MCSTTNGGGVAIATVVGGALQRRQSEGAEPSAYCRAMWGRTLRYLAGLLVPKTMAQVRNCGQNIIIQKKGT